MISIKSIRTIERLEGYRDSWDSLVKESGFSNIFLEYDWVMTWWNHFGHGGELRVLLAYEEGELIGIVPLMMRDGWVRVIRFIGYPHADYADFIFTRRKRAGLLALMRYFRKQHDWRTLMLLDEIPSHSDTLRYISEFRSDHRITTYSNSTMALDLRGSRFSPKPQSKWTRRNLRRLRAHGEPVMYEVKGQEERSSLLDMHIRMNIEDWRQRGLRSQFEGKGHQLFLHDIARVYQERCRIFCYISGERPIAVKVFLQVGDTVILYSHSHDIRYNKYGPGILSLYKVIEIFQDEGISVIDLSRGIEGYKEQFSNRIDENHGICIYPNRLEGLILKSYDLFKRSIMKRPRLHHRINVLRTRFTKGDT